MFFDMELSDIISLRRPLPPLGFMTAETELLTALASLITAKKPRVVVEAGSGVSSVVIGYGLEKNRRGKLYSLEHEETCYRESAEWLKEHELTDYCELIHAPIKAYKIDGEEWFYYDLSQLPPATIDLLFVDGPPGMIQPLARYPAVPLLASQLSPQATVILDDFRRPDEQQIAIRWLTEFPEFTLNVLKHPRRTAVLERRQTA
jgi:predicted O-methyltransferase YrrM